MRLEKVITVGSRGSRLAICQTQLIANRLQDAHPQFKFVVRKINTRGDELRDIPISRLGETGVFVKELEEALLAAEIDLAVHSLKDMSVQLPQGLEIAALCQREDARDVFISRKGSLSELSHGARIGTGSLRRAVQIKAFRPDLDIGDIRGNIDTRLRKLTGGWFDGIILAAAGLIRLGWEEQITEYLSTSICLPAVGQGTLAIEVRENDDKIKQMVSFLNHKPTRQATVAEQAFLRFLGGGCRTPIAAFARIQGESLELEGMVARPDGSKLLRTMVRGSAELPAQLGRLLGKELVALGAKEILA